MNPEEADRFGIEGEERRRFFRVYDDKNNRAPPAENSDWYRLISVDLENGGLAGSDSVGVVVPWAAPKPFDGLTGDHLLRVQMAVAEGQWRDHHSADDWVGNAVAKVLRLDLDRKSDRSRILELLRTWKKEGALKAIDGKDDRRKPVKFVVVGRWQSDNGAPVTQVERSAPV
jgi:hypothetical protein